MYNNSSISTLDLNDYTFLRTIGIGAHGRVKLAYDKKKKEYCVVKILKKDKLIKYGHIQHAINQKNILMNLKHPFIIELKNTGQDTKHLYLALQYAPGGDLWSYLRQMFRLDTNQAALYAAQVVLILQYLHNHKIVYRDIKPQNIAFDKKGYLKLVDFGLAKVVLNRTFTVCGTPEYLAPQIILCKGYGKGVDWWALGILIYQMIVGHDPFSRNDPMEIYSNILEGRIQFSKTFPRDAMHLVKGLVNKDLSRRLGCLKNGAEQIKQHIWFKKINYYQLLEKKIDMPYKPVLNSIDQNFSQYPQSSCGTQIVDSSGNGYFVNW